MGLYRRAGRPQWWVKFRWRGALWRRSTGETNRTAAVRAARQIRAQIERDAGPEVKGAALVALAALDVLRVERARMGDRRAATVEAIWRPLLVHLGQHRDASTITAADLAAYEGARRQEPGSDGRGVRGQTIRREIQALRRGISLAMREGIMTADPIDWRSVRVRSDPADPRLASKLWSAADIALALDHLSAKAKTLGIGAAMRLVQLTGLRLTELRRLRPGWAAGSDLRVPAIDGSKTRAARTIPMPAEVGEIIAAWRHDDDAPLWPTCRPNRALRLACERAGLAAVLTPRDLRAWYLTQAGRHDPVAAQRLAGHRSLATTSRYLGADAERMLAASRAAAEAAKGGASWGAPKKPRQKKSNEIKGRS